MVLEIAEGYEFVAGFWGLFLVGVLLWFFGGKGRVFVVFFLKKKETKPKTTKPEPTFPFSPSPQDMSAVAIFVEQNMCTPP